MKLKIETIQKRVARLKMAKVVDLTPQDSTDVVKSFRYLVMNLPAEKISPAKLEEMRVKAGSIGGSLKVRIATVDDIPGLCDLYNAAFFQCPDPYRPVSIDDMTEIYHRSTIVIGSLYGMDAAFIVLKVEEHEGKRVGVICGIAVHPRHRQKGLATGIGVEGWRHLAGKNLDYLQCEVYEKNEPSIKFITWVGFRPAGEVIIKAPSAAALNPLDRI